jgi:HAD superfamily phosphoserine phosphatase-like hydrolase
MSRVLASGLVGAAVLSTACAGGRPFARPSGLASHFEQGERLEAVLAAPGCLWVTDADGTLWSDDIGEGFLKALIRDRALVSPEAKGDVWAANEEKVRRDKGAGYAWAAQVMAGLPEEEVRRRAADFARTFVPEHLYPSMKALLAQAKARGCETWVVSASNQWVVEAAAPLLGLDPSHGVGIRVAVEEGRLTSKVLEPVTYKAGKVTAIARFIGRDPTLVTGDSFGDVEMLATAQHAGLVVQHDYSDPALLALARTSGWLLQPLPLPLTQSLSTNPMATPLFRVP